MGAGLGDGLGRVGTGAGFGVEGRVGTGDGVGAGRVGIGAGRVGAGLGVGLGREGAGDGEGRDGAGEGEGREGAGVGAGRLGDGLGAGLGRGAPPDEPWDGRPGRSRSCAKASLGRAQRSDRANTSERVMRVFMWGVESRGRGRGGEAEVASAASTAVGRSANGVPALEAAVRVHSAGCSCSGVHCRGHFAPAGSTPRVARRATSRTCSAGDRSQLLGALSRCSRGSHR